MSKGQETRQEIIRSAAPIFNRKGYAGTALSDLMEATGLKKGGIYRHFESKEQLAAEAFDYAWNTAVQVRQIGVRQHAHAVDQLKQSVRNFVERREGLVPGGCPLLNTAVDADNGNTALRARAKKALEQWLGRLRDVAKQGMARGEIRKGTDPEKLSRLVAGTLEGALVISRLERSDEPLQWAGEHLQAYLEGLRAADSEPAGKRRKARAQ